MTIELHSRDRAASLNRRLVVWGERAVAIGLFGLGLMCWMRLVGVYDAPLWRFDRMPTELKAAVASLAVLYPVAGIGLWMNVTWGLVVWIIALLVEGATVYGVEGGGRVLVLAQAIALTILLAFRLVGWWERRRAARV